MKPGCPKLAGKFLMLCSAVFSLAGSSAVPAFSMAVLMSWTVSHPLASKAVVTKSLPFAFLRKVSSFWLFGFLPKWSP